MNEDKEREIDKKIDSKGFSFVEILVVFIILGIIATISVFAVSRYRTQQVYKNYDALAKSSYNAMEEYLMKHPYKESATLETLEEDEFLSNRLDPYTKNSNCDGAVEISSEKGTSGTMDENTYTVYLCCKKYKRTYFFPSGDKSELEDNSYCTVDEEDDEPTYSPDPSPSPSTSPDTTYTLTYNSDGGNACSPSTVKKKSGELWGTLCKTKKTNYEQNGWFTEKNCKGTQVTSSSIAKKNLTVYACWVQNGVTCPAGKYLPKGGTSSSSCKVCKTANYCVGGTWPAKPSEDKGLTPCPDGYKNSAEGSSKITQCFIKVSGGHYLKTKKKTDMPACVSGKYKAAHNVFYDSTSTCDNCPSGYTNSASGSTQQSQCFMKVSKNKYVPTARGGSNDCPSGKYSLAHNVYYGKTSSCLTSPTVSITNPTNGNWSKESFKLTVSTNLSAANVKGWYFSFANITASTANIGSDSTTNWKHYSDSAGKKTFTTTNFAKERNQKAYIMVCNKDDVCAKNNTTIKIDKTAPKWSVEKKDPGCNDPKAEGRKTAYITDPKLDSGAAGSGYGRAASTYSIGPENGPIVATFNGYDDDGKAKANEGLCAVTKTIFVKYKICDKAGNCANNGSGQNY